MSVNTKMTAIADQIRTLSGTTEALGLDAMAIKVGDANTEVTTQEELIVQITTMLEGKVLPDTSFKIDVVTASSLPETVTDGQIVVITNTAVDTVYIDTDKPANPINGDVWVKMEAEANVALELSEASPYLRGGLTSAAQWNGSVWAYCDGYFGISETWEQFSWTLPLIGTSLNDCTWEDISKITALGKASEYFSVGDAKQITINGKVGNTTFSNLSIWAFIIGFDHNSSIEGNNTIHFQIGKSGQINGTNLCIADSKVTTASTSAGYFNMNYSNSASGGWESSKMRTVLLGSNYAPSSPLSDSLMAALPSDLRDVMKGVVKYSDNTGDGSDTASYVTTTTDYLWLLSEYEIYGSRAYANSAEKTKQKQYDYYYSGNPTVTYKHSDATTATGCWLRSPSVNNSAKFCNTRSNGNVNEYNASYSLGLTPAFCV